MPEKLTLTITLDIQVDSAEEKAEIVNPQTNDISTPFTADLFDILTGEMGVNVLAINHLTHNDVRMLLNAEQAGV